MLKWRGLFLSNKFDKLQKVLGADSSDEIVDLAVEKITELTDSAEKKDKKIAELEKKLSDEETDEEKKKAEEEAAKKKAEEDNDEDDDEDDDEGAKTDSAKALKDANEKLKKENEKLKQDNKTQGDAVTKLTDSVGKLEKTTAAIGKKQVRPLFHDSNDEIDELKKKRLSIYADSKKRGEK